MFNIIIKNKDKIPKLKKLLSSFQKINTAIFYYVTIFL